MADLTKKTPGEVLAAASVAEFIKELGLGIAAAQSALLWLYGALDARQGSAA